MRTFGIPFPLFDKAGDPGDGGSGGGSTAPGLTDEQKKEIGGLISAALKGEGTRMVAKAVEGAVKDLKLGETIAAEIAKLKPAEEDPAPKGGKQDPKIAALETRLAETEARLKAEAAERQKAVDEGRAKDARAALRSALTPHVRPEALDLATRDLFDAQRRVTIDDQGNVVMKVRRKDYAGNDEDVDMPITDAVGHWIKTPEGKFMAPPPSGGEGPKGGQGPRRSVQTGRDGLPHYDTPATTDAEKIRRAEEREQAYLARMNSS